MVSGVFYGAMLYLVLIGQLCGCAYRVGNNSGAPVRGWVDSASQWLALHAGSLPVVGAGLEVAERLMELGSMRQFPRWSIDGVSVHVENPRAMLRLRAFMEPVEHCLQELTYCSYGTWWRKWTNVWSWNTEWRARRMCKMRCFSCKRTYRELGKYIHYKRIGQDQNHGRSDTYKVPRMLVESCLALLAS